MTQENPIKKITPVDLFMFLAERGALTAFRTNRDKVLGPLFNGDVEEAISSAFVWQKSPQGHGFWSDLSLQWCFLCQPIGGAA